MASSRNALVLAYANCDTCRMALRWLAAHRYTVTVRPIVDEPPTADELARWVPASGVALRKWLNTSGQSYRALGAARVATMRDGELVAALAADGKLVKRPVVIVDDRVFVGFRPEQWETALG